MRLRLPFILAVLLGLSALLLVNSQYRARKLFIELEFAQTQTRELEIEWAQLQLKQSTLSKHARIEEKAVNELNMTRVTPANTQFLKISTP
ncbi:cell division protein FtsL [Oxalobacter paraformigenes]|uniref:Cell division protein FtsL n=1 Tax=Oxalobacter paraformigenes TaxID=556268 RepID=C3X5H9_9BURK|nr:cell division protein FtsL [Oxalobacter paraformigenes]EEO28465.1 cell division protein FtsL [Oxalobacter paraformigenes]